MICVQWGDKMSSYYEVRNGVKQGGVLSPILFILYMDVLLGRLKKSGTGCHIGSTFCGAFGYADDVVLLSPSLSGVKTLLEICAEYSEDYDVKFNPEKSKLMLFGGATQPPGGVTFMGGIIEAVQSDVHLGKPDW